MSELLNINSGRAIKILVMILLLDFLIGVAKAITKNEFNLNKMILGIVKKICYIALIALCNMVDILFNTGGELRLMTIMFLSSIDAISILENLHEIGVPIPERIKSVINNFSKIIISKNKVEVTTDEDNKFTSVNVVDKLENVETLEVNNVDEVDVILPKSDNET